MQGLRVAVLGSTSGIGRAVALELARSGADVIVHGKSSRALAESLTAEIQAMGRRSEWFLTDLADRAAGDRLVEDSWSLWGGLDGWIHFAGADILTGTGRGLTFDQKLETLMEIDLISTIRLCRAVGHRMLEQGGGAILTMGWDQAETGMEGDSGELFAATKGAVMAFSRSLALSLAPKVRVNVVAPGWIKTSWGEQASTDWQARVIRETPLRRWGTAEDVARTVRFLMDPASAFLTGQVIRVNGGAVRH